MSEQISKIEDLTSIEESILILLQLHRLYSQEIIKAFEDCGKGQRNISTGTLSAIVKRLEKRKLIDSEIVDGCIDGGKASRRKYLKLYKN
jgi:DNA-binding PadR family transcriptional regulator